jgi:hypothetical protein
MSGKTELELATLWANDMSKGMALAKGYPDGAESLDDSELLVSLGARLRSELRWGLRHNDKPLAALVGPLTDEILSSLSMSESTARAVRAAGGVDGLHAMIVEAVRVVKEEQAGALPYMDPATAEALAALEAPVANVADDLRKTLEGAGHTVYVVRG